MATRSDSADAMDAALARLEAGIRQSGAAVRRAKITPAQNAARTRAFQQARPISTPQTAAQQAAQAREYRKRQGPPDDFMGLPHRNRQAIFGREGVDLEWRMPQTLPRGEPFPTPESRLPGPAWDEANRRWTEETARLFRDPRRLRPEGATDPWEFRRIPATKGMGGRRMDRAMAVKCIHAALADLLASVKQSPQTPAQIQANLRQILAGTPGYASTPPSNAARQTGRSLRPVTGGGIEPTPWNSGVSVGGTAPTALNWAREENRQQLRSMLGRNPTPEERRAGMQVRRKLAKDAGQPFVAINPDNRPPSYGPHGETGWGSPYPRKYLRWPETMTNPQMRRAYPFVREDLGADLERDPTPQEVRAGYRRLAANNLFYGGQQHPINPNANIRSPRVGSYADFEAYDPEFEPEKQSLNIDPRLPERYNNTLPPNQRMTQEQMDKIRRDYYTQNPNLVPQPAQPGYEAWRKQNLRGK